MREDDEEQVDSGYVIAGPEYTDRQLAEAFELLLNMSAQWGQVTGRDVVGSSALELPGLADAVLMRLGYTESDGRRGKVAARVQFARWTAKVVLEQLRHDPALLTNLASLGEVGAAVAEAVGVPLDAEPTVASVIAEIDGEVRPTGFLQRNNAESIKHLRETVIQQETAIAFADTHARMAALDSRVAGVEAVLLATLEVLKGIGERLQSPAAAPDLSAFATQLTEQWVGAMMPLFGALVTTVGEVVEVLGERKPRVLRPIYNDFGDIVSIEAVDD